MGFLGFGKKKPTNDEIIAKKFGEATTEPKKNTRIENKEIAEKSRVNEYKKDVVIEKINDLRKSLMRVPAFYSYIDKVQDILNDFKFSKDVCEPRFLTAVDGFILKTIDEVNNYVNRKSLIGVDSAIAQLRALINDRIDTTGIQEYYADPKYVDLKLKANKLAIKIKIIEQEDTNLIARFKELKEKGNDPMFASAKGSILNELQSIKRDHEAKQNLIKELTDKREILETGMNEVVRQIQNKVSENDEEDIVDISEDILETKISNDLESNKASKLKEKVQSTSRKQTTESELTIGGSLNSSNSSMDVDKAFDDIEL